MFFKIITNLFRKRKHPEGVVVRDTPLVVFIERVKAIPNNTLRVFCVFILLVIILKLATNHKVAAWFDNNWFYRQNVQITNSSGGTLTQYQVSFTLDTQTLITAGKMKTDCADIRITDPTGNSLPLWIEESTTRGCNTTTTNIWTKVPSISLFGTSLFVYYGNPQSVTVSNGKSVFEMFDNFSKNTLDKSIWNTNGTPTIVGGAISLLSPTSLVSRTSPTTPTGIGRLIFRAKTAATNLTGGIIGLSSNNNLSTDFHTAESASLSTGGLEEKLSDFGANLISHYKLEETTTTDANQFKASGYLDTGKLGQGVSIYGNSAGTLGSTLTFQRGSQISGNNYEHFNTNQGTITFWVNPSWNGNGANLIKYFFDSGHNFYIWNYHTNFYITTPGIDFTARSISGWTAGSWHFVSARWDSDNAISGSNYFCIGIDGTETCGRTSAWNPPSSPAISNNIGSDYNGQNQADSLIDDFAIFDRVLSTTEITNIYNTGTGREAGYVGDSSLKFYAKMDGTGTLSPVTYNLGASASKMTAKTTELTGGINLLTNGNMEAASGGLATGWSIAGSGTAADAEAANILFDTRSQKFTTVAFQDRIGQAVTLSANTTYYYSVWAKNTTGTGSVRVLITDGVDLDNGNGIAINSSTWTQYSGIIKTDSHTTWYIRIQEQWSVTPGATIYFDNYILTPSLVDNGGMEGTYVAGVAPGWTLNGTATPAESADVHSGSKVQSVTNTPGSTANSVYKTFSVTAGNYYLVSGWVKRSSGTGNSYVYLNGSSGVLQEADSFIYIGTSSTYTKFSKIVKSIASGTIYLWLYGSTTDTVSLFDDISIIPLDSVSGSFKSWTPVNNTTSTNPLSVHGNATGVTSTTSGPLNNAYTFDGSTGYLRQKTYAVNIGTLSYGINTFTDDGQTFSGYKAANPATYMIVITNSDNTTSWGYIGAGGASTLVNVYTTIAESVAGFNGTSPTGKTPVGYEIRKTDYQITGDMTLGTWIKWSTNGQYNMIFDKGSGGGYEFRLYNGNLSFISTNCGQLDADPADAIDTNWHHVIFVKSSSAFRIYKDGSEIKNSNISCTMNDVSSPFVIGRWFGSETYKFNGSIDSPFVLNSALTADQVKALYNYSALSSSHTGTKSTPGNSANPVYDTSYHTYDISVGAALVAARQDNVLFSSSSTNLPTSSQFMRIENTDTTNNLTLDWIASAKQASTAPVAAAPASEEKSTNPVAYWKLDEGNSTLAHDSTSNRNDGTITGSTWQDESMCVSGKCLKFNGTSDNISVSNIIKNIQTVEFWVKPNSVTSGAFINLNNGTANITVVNGVVTVGAGFSSPIIYVNGVTGANTAPLRSNSWSYVTVTTATPFDSTSANTIGKSSSTYLNGFIDDVKIYGYVRTAGQIKSDFNGVDRVGAALVAARNSGSPQGMTPTNLSNGLVGLWRMNESTWSGTLNEVIDSSGNGNNGQAQGATGGKAYPTTGKFGNGGYFDGVDDYVSTNLMVTRNALVSTGITLSSWIKTNTTGYKGIVGQPTVEGNGKFAAFGIAITDTNKAVMMSYNDSDYVYATGTKTINDNNWHHLVGSYNPNTAKLTIYVDGLLEQETTISAITTLPFSVNVRIGRIAISHTSSPTQLFPGLIDETRIYNRALTPAEVRALYNYSPTRTVYFPMEENKGTTTKDIVGGNIASFSTPLFSSKYPLWSQGKYGSAIDYNGIDSYLTSPDANSFDQSGSFSLTSIVKPLSVGTNIIGGTVVSKGTNYRLSVIASPANGGTWQSRTSFSTNAITTQLSGTAINDVYFYDTTKDTNYGDGTAADPLVWRFDSTKSWYSETKDHTYTACNISTDDRCGASEFPEKSYIVVANTPGSSYVYIFDAQENAMWMKFVSDNISTRNMGTCYGGTSLPTTSVFALNGKIYTGSTGFSSNCGLYRINFINDSGIKNTLAGQYTHNGNISQRNSNLGHTYSGALTLVSGLTNDVHAAYINNKQYVAVATDGGVSVINETDGTVVNITSTSTYKKSGNVMLVGGKIYFTGAQSGSYSDPYTLLSENIPVSNQSANGYSNISGIISYGEKNTSYGDNKPKLDGNYGVDAIKGFYITAGTSTIDGTSNTIYIALNTGLSIIQEKQGDEVNGSVKYFTKDYITEEMIGNIQGAWTFNGNGTIANGVDITNRAVLSTAAGLTNPASPMTSSNTNGTGMAYSAGVRGTGITFDGTDDYLKQKVYYDQTGATFGPTVHGLNLSTTAAFYRAQGRDLSTYHGTDGSSTPYMLVLKDSANKTAWGYIGSTDAAETLDVEKVTNGTMEADANWSNYFSPTTNERSIEQAHLGTYSRKVITDASAEGIQSDTFTTTTGKLYKMSVWIYPTAGTLYQIGLRKGGSGTMIWSGNLGAFTLNAWNQKTVYLTEAVGGASAYVLIKNSDASSTFYVDDVTLTEVTDVGVDGVHIVSTKNGATRTWADIQSGFNYNDTTYTFEIRKTDFQLTGNMTVGAWINPDTWPSWSTIFEKNGAQTIKIQRYGSTNEIALYSQGSSIHGGSVTNGTWSYVVATLNGSVGTLYVNGNQVAQASGFTSPRADTFHSFNLAYTVDGPTWYFKGSMDEPFVSASALTADEIKRMYDVGRRSLTAQGTNALNGTSNQVNAVVAGGLSHFVLPNNQLRITNNKMYAGTAGGGVSEIDLNSDTLVNYYTSATTPAINSSTINALTITSGGNFIAGMDSGMSRVNDVSGRVTLSAVLAPTKWISLAGIFNKDTGYYYLYENGIEVGRTNVGTSHTPITNNYIFVLGGVIPASGAQAGIYSNFYGSIDQTSIYNYPVNNINLNSPVRAPAGTGVALSGAKKSLSPIAYYDFDEGTGTLVHNLGTGGTSLNGTTSNTTWSLSGKVNKALSFNGTSSYVNISNPQITQGMSQLTISAWINPATITGGQTIASKWSTSGYAGNSYIFYFCGTSVNCSANGELRLLMRNDSGTEYSVLTGTSNITADIWQHVVATYDGINLKLFVNGILVKSQVGSGLINNGTRRFLFGAMDYTSFITYYYSGLIDEPKIYNYALTADEIKTDYNRGSSLVLGSVSDTSKITGTPIPQNSSSAKYCVPGDTASCAPPVGEWNFENNVKDTSGNGNDGSWSGTGTKRYVQGKIGRAGKFTYATTDYVTTNKNLLNPDTISVSSWFKINDTLYNYMIVGKGGGTIEDYKFGTNASSTNLRFDFTDGAGWNTYRSSDANLVANVWYYATLAHTFGDSTSTKIYLNGKLLTGSWIGGSGSDAKVITDNNLVIGNSSSPGGQPFSGLIDQVKIYNYARSPAQIAWDYNKGEPVAYYDFDECTGSVIHDRSTNRLDGTLTNATPGTCTDGTGTTFWSAGQTGKYGKSGKFDGVDDYVSVPGTLSTNTVAFWIKPTSNTASIINLNATAYITAASGVISVGAGFSSPTIYVNGVTGANTAPLQANVWNHIVVTTNTVITANAITIGKANGAYTTGQMDEVKIFNYALTSTQVKQLYNQNSAIRFGQ